MEITSNKSGTDFMSAPLLYFKKQNAILYRCDFHAFTVIGVLVHHPVALAAQIEQRKGQIGAIPFQRGRRFVFIVGGNAVAYVARQTVFVKYADRIVFLRREFDSDPAGMFNRFFQIFLKLMVAYLPVPNFVESEAPVGHFSEEYQTKCPASLYIPDSDNFGSLLGKYLHLKRD